VGKILPLSAFKLCAGTWEEKRHKHYLFLKLSTLPGKPMKPMKWDSLAFSTIGGFPNGPVSAADTGPGGSHASQPVRLAPGPWPVDPDSPAGRHAAVPPCRHAAMPPHLPMPPAPPSSTPHPGHIWLFFKYSGGRIRVGKMVPLPALKLCAGT
jgi:hypothetical protein